MIPWGIIISSGSVALGGIIGSVAGHHFPKDICEFLSRFFGIISIAIGVGLIIKAHSLSPVILSLLLGGIIGEALKLESRLETIPQILSGKNTEGNSQFVERYTGVLVLICSGSLGLMGAMTEGLTGDSSVMLTKSVLDLFGSAIFASTLGAGVALIAVPQIIIYLLLFCLSGFILPYTTEIMTADFMSCGGIIALATGFRIAEIQPIRVASLLPALILVMPISSLWNIMMG